MEEFIKNNNIEVVRVKTKEDIDDMFKTFFELQLKGNYLFRGGRKYEHFTPTLVRKYNKNGISSKSITLGTYETSLLQEYAHYSIPYLPPYQSSLDWVASAQHFGIPTRLIDWSFDPFCALYFSVFINDDDFDETEECEKVYKLAVVDYTENLYYHKVPDFPNPDANFISYGNSYIDNFISTVFFLMNSWAISGDTKDKKQFEDWYLQKLEDEKEDEHKLIFFSLTDSNPRIIAQKGLFQFPRRFRNEIYKDCITEDILKASYQLYLIHKDCRKQIIKKLKNINISSPRLFPDLPSICDYISRLDSFPSYDLH